MILALITAFITAFITAVLVAIRICTPKMVPIWSLSTQISLIKERGETSGTFESRVFGYPGSWNL